jgi:hypothetical protein
MVAEPLAQVSVPVVDALAFGTAVLVATEVVAVFVQPVEGSVTVTVYAPCKFTVAVAVLPPETTPGPLQLNVAPGVVELPLTTAFPPQLIDPVVVAEAFGKALTLTDTVPVFEQPDETPVTV